MELPERILRGDGAVSRQLRWQIDSKWGVFTKKKPIIVAFVPSHTAIQACLYLMHIHMQYMSWLQKSNSRHVCTNVVSAHTRTWSPCWRIPENSPRWQACGLSYWNHIMLRFLLYRMQHMHRLASMCVQCSQCVKYSCLLTLCSWLKPCQGAGFRLGNSSRAATILSQWVSTDYSL